MPASATPAIDLVRREGVRYEVHAYELPERHGRARDERPEYGLEAAAALGVEPARVFKTLIASVDGRLVAAVVPVDRQLDLKALAAAGGGRRADLADVAAAERASGSVAGGISPLGLRRPMPVVIDVAAEAHATILISAGRRGLQLELAPRDLIRLAEASVASIARPG
jgi:Cys-tRNA(Pro)/Cys-tRNA(Cys) deacylase